MMLIKAHRGDGVYDLYEADRVSFLTQGCAIEIPAGHHPFSEDERFPSGWEFCHVVYPDDQVLRPDGPDSEAIRLVRWVQWFHPTREECHLLVTDGAVYICNEQGDTIEALR